MQRVPGADRPCESLIGWLSDLHKIGENNNEIGENDQQNRNFHMVSIDSVSALVLYLWLPVSKIAKKKVWKRAFLLIRHWKYSAILWKNTLLHTAFRQFCLLGKIL